MTQLQAVANFSSTNAVWSDHAILAAGLPQGRAMIASYHGYNWARLAYGGVAIITWTFRVELYAEWAGADAEATADTQLAVDRQNIISRLGQYPSLNNTAGVHDTRSRGEGPGGGEIAVEFGGLRVKREYIFIEVDEEQTETISG